MSGPEMCVNPRCRNYRSIHEGMCDLMDPSALQMTAEKVIEAAGGWGIPAENLDANKYAARQAGIPVTEYRYEPDGDHPVRRVEDQDYVTATLTAKARELIKAIGEAERARDRHQDQIAELTEDLNKMHQQQAQIEETIKRLRTPAPTPPPYSAKSIIETLSAAQSLFSAADHDRDKTERNIRVLQELINQQEQRR